MTKAVIDSFESNYKALSKKNPNDVDDITNGRFKNLHASYCIDELKI